MKGLIKLQKLLLVSIPFSEILSIYLVIFFLLILTHLCPCSLYTALFLAYGWTQYLFCNLLLIWIFFWNSLFLKGALLSLTIIFQRSMLTILTIPRNFVCNSDWGRFSKVNFFLFFFFFWDCVRNLINQISYNFRNSQPEVFCKKGVLRNFAKFTWKRLYQSLFSDKIVGLRPEHRTPPVAVSVTSIISNFRFYGSRLTQNTSGGCFCNFYNK